jgi:hypothetical protein
MVSLMLPIEIVRWISESSGLTSTEMLGPLASRAAPSAKANHASRSSCPTFAVGSQESRHGCPCSSRPSKATLPMALAVDGHHVEDLAHLVPLLADARRSCEHKTRGTKQGVPMSCMARESTSVLHLPQDQFD